MKQPEDTKTIDMLQAEKRGRGRPRLEHALTTAERAKRYRDNKRSRLNDASVTKKINVTEKDNKVFRLECEITALRSEIDSYRKFHEQRAELDDLAQRKADEVCNENYLLQKTSNELRNWISSAMGTMECILQDRERKKGVSNIRMEEIRELLRSASYLV